MSRKLRYLSLCSGVEAASLAWEQFGFEPVAFCEIEPYAAAVLANRWPSVPNLGDMTAYPWERFTEEFGQVDICVGGPPCQAFSIAGLRQGLHDPRGNLTLEYMRVIDAVKPEFLVYENVPGIISDKTHAFDKLLEGLQELGYALDLDILDAQEFGVAQRRRRVFVLGWRADRIVERHDDLSRLFMSQVIGNALTVALNNVIQNQSGVSPQVRLAQMGCDSERALASWLDEISLRWRDAEKDLRDRVGLTEVVPAAWSALVGDVSDERDAIVSLGALSVILSVATRDLSAWPDIWQNEGINAKRALGVFADYARRKTEQPSLFDGFDDTLHVLGSEAAGEADALGDLGMGRRQEVPAEPPCLRGDTQEGTEKGKGAAADASGGVGGSNCDGGRVKEPMSCDGTVGFVPGCGGNTGLGIQDELSPAMTISQPVAVAIVQNQRDEIRLMGGDGQIAGTLSASQSGTHKQETLLCMASGQANAEIERGGVSPTLTVLHEVPIVVRQ